MNRREFLTGTAGATLGMVGTSGASRAASGTMSAKTAGSPMPAQDHPIAIFTDFVDDAEFGFSYEEVASLIGQLGVAGPDLTVRPGGLVPPERVAVELPRAAEAFAKHGLSIPVITTAILSIDDPVARPTLKTAASLGIEYYRVGYYHYHDPAQWQSETDSVQKKLEQLVAAGRWEGIQAIFHNHSGTTVGGAMWDSFNVLAPLDPKWISSSFDCSHATIEGGKLGWILGFHLLASRINVVTVKDFVWEKVSGEWRTRWVPMGQGMVQWSKFFKMLADINFRGPFLVSIEYEPGGNTKSARFDKALAAADQDVKFLKGHLKQAFG